MKRKMLTKIPQNGTTKIPNSKAAAPRTIKKKKKELHATHYHRINGPGCNPQDNRVDKYEIEIFQLV